jgi:hypothetical protein
MPSTSITIRYSLGIYAGLILYFFIMKLLGLEQVTELRLFNFFIVLGGIYMLLKRNMEYNSTSYFQNLFLGFRTAALAIVMVSISLFVYLKAINPSFMAVLENSMVWGNHLTVFKVTLVIAIEGIASSFLLTYMVMQYMKNYNSTSNIETSQSYK